MVMEFEVAYFDKKVYDFWPFITSSLKSLLETLYSSQTVLYCFATNLHRIANIR